jgi:hypothetical protein
VGPLSYPRKFSAISFDKIAVLTVVIHSITGITRKSARARSRWRVNHGPPRCFFGRCPALESTESQPPSPLHSPFACYHQHHATLIQRPPSRAISRRTQSRNRIFTAAQLDIRPETHRFLHLIVSALPDRSLPSILHQPLSPVISPKLIPLIPYPPIYICKVSSTEEISLHWVSVPCFRPASVTSLMHPRK